MQKTQFEETEKALELQPHNGRGWSADNMNIIFGPSSSSSLCKGLSLSHVFQAPWILMLALTKMQKSFF